MKKQLIVIYGLIGLLFVLIAILFASGASNQDLGKLSERLTKVEFFQEATRLRDNIVGFKQVNASLANDSERTKHCNESKTLLTEWSSDINKLNNNFSSYLDKNNDARAYFESIDKLNTTLTADCNNLTNK